MINIWGVLSLTGLMLITMAVIFVVVFVVVRFIFKSKISILFIFLNSVVIYFVSTIIAFVVSLGVEGGWILLLAPHFILAWPLVLIGTIFGI